MALTLFRNSFKNFPKNIILTLSFWTLMFLNFQPTTEEVSGLCIGFLFLIILSGLVTGIWDSFKKTRMIAKIFSALSAAGISLFAAKACIRTLTLHFRGQFSLPGLSFDKSVKLMSYGLAIFSFLSAFVFTTIIVGFVADKLGDAFSKISRFEIAALVILIVVTGLYSFYAFYHSNAFWGTSLYYDVIYTSDTPRIVNDNAYLRIFHMENDFRQPLFSYFSMPFVGIGYLVGFFAKGFSNFLLPYCMNLVQIVLLVISNYLIAKMLKLSKYASIAVMAFMTTTYTYLLFSVMMEQYIIAYFWLIFAIYVYESKKELGNFTLTAAGGTLVTSFSLILLNITSGIKNDFKGTIVKTIKSVLFFAVCFISLGRLDLIFKFKEQMSVLSGFAGGVGFMGRTNQYLSFISSIFVYPKTIIDSESLDHVYLRLDNSNSEIVNVFGLIILILCIAGFLLSYKELLSKIAICWISFSIILMVFMGWGSAENGMILYSLYFGWAYVVLIVSLISKISEKIKSSAILPIFFVLASIALIVVNYTGIKELFNFAFTHYNYIA